MDNAATQENIESPQETAAPEAVDHAVIAINAEEKGLVISVHGVNDASNPAVRFATWIGENAQALMLMFEASRKEKEAPPASAQPQIAEVGVPRLVSATGELLSVGEDGLVSTRSTGGL